MSGLCVFAGVLVLAQLTTPPDDPAKYKAQAQFGEVRVAADFWGSSLPLDDGAALATRGHLVVEVAFFAPVGKKLAIKPGDFSLKVDGKVIYQESAGSVTLGYVVPDYRDRGPRVEVGGSVGPVNGSAGADPPQPKFPGDTQGSHYPPPQRSEGRDPELRKDQVDPVKAAKDAALPEGDFKTPISGYLYFPYQGKLKNIKKVELEYAGALGSAALVLR